MRDASGLTLCKVADIVPFLKEDQVLSDQPLAALTVGPIPAELRASLAIVDLDFPVMHTCAQEGILVHGSLLQLGKLPVKHRPAAKELKLTTIDTQTLKLWIHRDQWQGDWQSFNKAPIRQLMDKFPNFVARRSPKACGAVCQHFHPPVGDEGYETVLFDVWARAWTTDKFAKSSPELAICFTCLVRVPKAAADTLQNNSGTSGLYMEPRTSDGRAPDPSYETIWLPDLELPDILCKRNTTPLTIAVTRKPRRSTSSSSLPRTAPSCALTPCTSYRLCPTALHAIRSLRRLGLGSGLVSPFSRDMEGHED